MLIADLEYWEVVDGNSLIGGRERLERVAAAASAAAIALTDDPNITVYAKTRSHALAISNPPHGSFADAFSSADAGGFYK
jgi:hypothetical protein